MRRSLEKFSNHPTLGNVTKHTLIINSSSSSAFSTSAGGGSGGGRGRGRIGGFQFTAPGKSTEPPSPDTDDDPKASSSFPSGLGHGRGKPLPLSSTPSPILPSFVSPTTSIGRGGGRMNFPPPSQSSDVIKKSPIFFVSKEGQEVASTTPKLQQTESNLPSSILNVLAGGAGRGKPPTKQSILKATEEQENRHLRPPGGKGKEVVTESSSSASPKLSTDEAVNYAIKKLSRAGGGGGDEEQEGSERGRGGRGGFRGRGGRGTVGGWRGRSRDGGGNRGQEKDDDYGTGLYLGDNADGEKLAKRVGPDNMNKLVEAFEEMSGRVLPSPMEDAYLDALHTNFMIECEPEYVMEDFSKNPDIDETPPIPLPDALEKMKPFLMAYEGIQSQQEWEEVVKETMEKVPIMKGLVDYYSGPDRVTAKKQQEELERVAKTLPESAPASVKRFTDRALLSLQSNPGWGFHRKCQFMDKLVSEVSKQYK